MYTVKQAQEILKAEPVDLFEKAHQVGDIHPNGKWVWTEIHPGKFDWRVIGGRRNKKSASAGGSYSDSNAKTQSSGSKPSPTKKTVTAAPVKATAKPTSRARGITKNADGSLTMKSPDIDSTADVSKLLDEVNCSKNAKGEYKVKVKSLGVNRGTMTLSPKEMLSYARQYSTSGNTVTFTPVKDDKTAPKSTTQTAQSSSVVPADAFKGITLSKQEKQAAFSIANKFATSKKDFDFNDVGDALVDDETLMEADDDTLANLNDRIYETAHSIWEKKNKSKKKAEPKTYTVKDAWGIIKNAHWGGIVGATPIAILPDDKNDASGVKVILQTSAGKYKCYENIGIGPNGKIDKQYAYSSPNYKTIREAMNYAETGRGNARYRDKSRQIPDSAWYAPKGGTFDKEYLSKQK